jgi:hypothetical protein
MSKIRVEFRTYDGALLRGDYFPADVEHAPIIILTQGVSIRVPLCKVRQD